MTLKLAVQDFEGRSAFKKLTKVPESIVRSIPTDAVGEVLSGWSMRK